MVALAVSEWYSPTKGYLPALRAGILSRTVLPPRDDLIDPRLGHVELLRPLVLVGDDQDEGRAGLDLDDVRLEAVLLDHERDLLGRLCAGRERRYERRPQKESRRACHDHSLHFAASLRES